MSLQFPWKKPTALRLIVLTLGATFLASCSAGSSSTDISSANVPPSNTTARTSYHLANKFTIGGDPGWDYVAIDPETRRVYITHFMKIEVLDAGGKVVGTVPSTKRRGLSRVTWSMRLKPPRVPPAASAAR